MQSATPQGAPTEAALLRLAVKLSYKAVALPKLNLIAAAILLCGLDRGIVVRTINIKAVYDMAVGANYTLICHRILPLEGSERGTRKMRARLYTSAHTPN
jgi:hypothetical protein